MTFQRLAATIFFCCCTAVLDESGGLAKSSAATDLLAPLHSGQFEYIGSRSCMSTACHGEIPIDRGFKSYEDIGYQGLEFQFWSQKDPHARANETLFSEKSRRMLRRLAGDRYWTTAHYRNCESCHNLNPKTRAKPLGRFDEIAEAVSCESCHGPASNWIHQHHLQGFTNLSSSEKAMHGMVNTKDLRTRAALCADCHVGSGWRLPNGQPFRQVDHDMIAAGHPVLRFELSSYHGRLPKHWDWQQERMAVADQEVLLWVLGQLANTRATLNLSNRRAALSSSEKVVKPDFADFDCFACHQDLTVRDREESHGNRIIEKRLGQPRLRRWNYGLVTLAAQAAYGENDSKQIGNILDNLGKQMTLYSTDKTSAQLSHHAMFHDVMRRLSRSAQQPIDPRGIANQIMSLESDSLDTDWEMATHHFLAIQALHANQQRVGLDDRRKFLAFPMHADTPELFLNSSLRTRKEDRLRFEKLLDKFHD